MKRSYIVIDRERCKGCYLCVETCPRVCISVDGKINAAGYYPAVPDSNVCSGCALCATVCPDVAIEVYREE